MMFERERRAAIKGGRLEKQWLSKEKDILRNLPFWTRLSFVLFCFQSFSSFGNYLSSFSMILTVHLKIIAAKNVKSIINSIIRQMEKRGGCVHKL